MKKLPLAFVTLLFACASPDPEMPQPQQEVGPANENEDAPKSFTVVPWEQADSVPELVQQ